MRKSLAALARRATPLVACLPLILSVVPAHASLWTAWVKRAASATVHLGAAEALRASRERVGIVLGRADAPVSVVVYSSMTCSHCATFHETVLPELTSRFVDTGLMRIEILPFPLDGYAMAGAMLVGCVAPEQRLALTGELFGRRADWVVDGDPTDALRRIVGRFGLSEDGTTTCLSDDDALEDVRIVAMAADDKEGVRVTPTFIVNGTTTWEGGRTIDDFTSFMSDVMSAEGRGGSDLPSRTHSDHDSHEHSSHDSHTHPPRASSE